MAAPNHGHLIRDIITLLQTRTFRHANIGDADSGVTGTVGHPRVFRLAAGGTVPSGTGKTYIVVELDTSKMADFDDKGFGSHHPIVPETGRP